MSATPALLLAAGGVGLGHAVLPDHWLPLAVVGRSRRYPLARVARLSLLAGLAHVTVSLALGGAVVAIGLQFRGSVESAQSTIVGALLLGTAALMLLLELTGRRHGHSHGHGHSSEHAPAGGGHHHAEGRPRALLPFMVSFGAAASPDLTILPVFLAATAAGVGAALGSLAVFAAVTVATFVALTVAATAGGYQVRGAWLEQSGNFLTAGLLLALGVLVLVGLI